ncbi:DNA repair and recombination protein RadA [Haloprofundus salinisoli]|uniref:DNA repair and recombination protein RadA n=1 Tax=Haloprofundus salinisoli TaxID=2876193 RepID=UPI001CC9B34A|nr:DNA repair and recombination protein RadA [Haloprofundus salinisoli]
MAATNLERLPGVGPATAEKLNAAGYDSYRTLAVASPAEIAGAADIGETAAGDIVHGAREFADVGRFETGVEMLRHRKQVGKLRWGVPEVDDLLGGGVETQSITEAYGGYGVGKSQVTHQLTVNVQLARDHGGLEGRALFVDTENTFRPERIDEMVRGLDDRTLSAELDRRGIGGSPTDDWAMDALVGDFLDRIHVAEAYNSDHQMLLAENARELVSEAEDTEWPVRLLCVDSLTAHFRAEYLGRGALAARQQKLNRHIHDLLRIAHLYNVAVVVTNQVQSNPDAFFGDPTRPIGGNILGHASSVRLYLRNARGSKRVVKLVDAPNLPDGEAVMRVEGSGLCAE